MMILKMMKMKKIILSAVVLGCFATLYFGCKKARPIKEFDLSFTNDIVVSAASFTPGVNDYYATITPNIGPQLDANSMNSDIVGEIYCTNFNFKIKSPALQNLNFSSNYEFFMTAGDQKEEIGRAHV